MHILGIDVGGSGIKGAPVDTDTGELLAERLRIKTPKKAEPEPIAEVVKQIAQSFNWDGPIGIGFPAPIKSGVAMMAANISEKWVGVNADALFTKITKCDCTLVNDADAAGLAFDAVTQAREQGTDIVMIDTPPGMPETAYQAMLLADVILLPCGPSPLDLMALQQSLALAEKARAARREKKTRIRFVPSKVAMSTNLSKALPATLADMGRKVLPAISLRVALAEAVESGLTIVEFAPGSTSHVEFDALAKAVVRILAR